MSADLFAKLIRQVESTDLSNSGNRWIARDSDEDAEFLSSAKTEPLRLGRQLGIISMAGQDRRIFGLYGLGSGSDKFVEGLANVPSTPALFQLSVAELSLFPTASESEIRNVLEGRSDQSLPYDGHDLVEIQGLFEPITYWQADDNFDWTGDIHRVAGSSICRMSFASPLLQPDHLISEFDSIFLEGSAHLPFPLLLQAFLASFWQSQFVEIYRCIEQLFPAEKVLSLRTKLGSKRSLRQINSFLVDALNWRPYEDLAIKSLLAVASEEVIEDFRVALRLDPGGADLRSVIAGRIYQVRNSVVHYRGGSTQARLPPNEWAALNQSMLKLARELYSRFAQSYF